MPAIDRSLSDCLADADRAGGAGATRFRGDPHLLPERNSDGVSKDEEFCI